MVPQITVEEASGLPEGEYMLFREALQYIQKKYQLLGFEIAESTLYSKIRRGQLPNTKKVVHDDGGHRYLLKKADVEKLRFQGRIAWPELTFIDSSEKLEQLKEQYGDLVDTNGLIKEIYEYTQRQYGKGKLYSKAAIKARRQLKTVLVVGWTGTEKRRNLWYPKNQIPLLGLRPDMRKRKKGERVKKAS